MPAEPVKPLATGTGDEVVGPVRDVGPSVSAATMDEDPIAPPLEETAAADEGADADMKADLEEKADAETPAAPAAVVSLPSKPGESGEDGAGKPKPPGNPPWCKDRT